MGTVFFFAQDPMNPFRFAVRSAVVAPLFLLVGCGAGIVPYTGTTTPPPATPAPIITLAPTSLTFSGTVGQTSAAQTVVVGNIGNATLNFSGITLNDTADYALSNGCSSTLAAGQNCTLSITFKPQTAASLPSSIALVDNSGNVTNATQTVTLSGSGSSVPAPVITIAPTSLSFGNGSVLQLTASQTVTIGNSGNATLNISSIVLGDPANYTLDSTCGTTLAPTATCTLTVAFDPQTTGSLPSTITLTDNSGNVSGVQQTVALSGTGTAAPEPIAMLAPLSQTFPDTAAASSSAAQTVTLTNTGNAALSITNIAYSGAAFSETTTCPSNGSLPAANSCTFSITFTPAAASTPYTGSITVTDNSGGVAGSIQTATFSGNGAAAASSQQLTLTPASATFPDTPVSQTSSALTYTLTNTSTSGTASGIAVSLAGGVTIKAFAQTNNCAATLAPLASCTINVTFTPYAQGSYLGDVSVTYTGATSALLAQFSGNGVGACSGNLFSPTTITFPTTKVGTTSAVATSILTNCGTAPLTISSVTLTGADASYFTQSNNCGTTVAAGGTCTISSTFSPDSARNFNASVVFTDNGSGSPQTLPLTGTGTTSSISYQLLVFPESDNSVTPLYNFIKSATKTVDMTMYEMQDTTFTSDLVADCARGVRVRVIFSSSVASSSATAYSALNSAGANCSAVDSNTAFTNTHQKTITIDGALATAQTAILSLNLQTQYYSTTRDFGMIENDPADIAAIEATFNMDYAAGGTNSSSDYNYQPGAGDDLIWSPTTAQADMLSLINNATKTLDVENEEMSASNIVSAFEAACQRGVTVHITMVEDSTKAPYSEYSSEWTALEAAGCKVHVYPDTSTGLYIHAKAVVADYSLSTQSVYMGSINYSTASMTRNRELGLYVFDAPSITLLENTLVSDFNGAAAY